MPVKKLQLHLLFGYLRAITNGKFKAHFVVALIDKFHTNGCNHDALLVDLYPYFESKVIKFGKKKKYQYDSQIQMSNWKNNITISIHAG